MKLLLLFPLTLLFVLFFNTSQAQLTTLNETGTVLLVKLTDQEQMRVVRGILNSQIPDCQLKGYYQPKESFIVQAKNTDAAVAKNAMDLIKQKLPGCVVEQMTAAAYNAMVQKNTPNKN